MWFCDIINMVLFMKYKIIKYIVVVIIIDTIAVMTPEASKTIYSLCAFTVDKPLWFCIIFLFNILYLFYLCEEKTI